MLSAVLLLLACCLPRTAHAQGACGEWTQTAIGAPSSGTAQFDACAPGTITITSAGIGSSSADIQYMVQRELCGDGTFDVKIESISNGRAGLEIRADNAAGSVKAGIETALTSFIFRVFRTATDAAQSQQQVPATGHRWLRLVRSGSNIQLFWSPNGTNWTSAALYTNMALPACARIGIFVESNNAAVATGVFNSLSVSGFTSPGNAPATTFSFAAGSLNAEAGQSAQVCVNIANPCACAPASVQVALQGNAAPHLSGFSTQTLQFQSGEVQKCFSLATTAAPGDGSYTLILQNPTGGNDAAIGAQSALAVAVTGEPETPTDCPWAGPDREICRGESVLIGCPSGGANPSNYCFRWVPEEGLETPHQEYSDASPSETTTYTLYVTDDQGNLIGSDEVTVTIKNEYTASIFPEEAEICPGESITLEVVLDGNSQNITYLWETGETTSSIVVQPEYSRSYRVEISDELSGCRETVRQLVQVHNVDMIRPIIEPSVICELPAPPGLAPRLPNDASQAKSEGDCSRNDSWLYVGPLSDGVSISWSTGETGVDNISVYEAGQYSVSITYPSNGCTVVVPFEVTSCVEVVVEPTSSTSGESLLDAGEGYLSYLWHDGSTGQTIPLGGAGTYAVTVVNENGCVGKWETTIEDFTDINDVYMVLWASPPNTLDRHLYIWGEGANNSSLDRKAIEAIVAKQTAPVNGGVDKIFWTPTPMHNDFEQIDRMMNRDQLRIYPMVIENGEAKSHFLNTDLNVYETYKFQLNLPGQVYDLDRTNGRYFDITSFSGLPDMASAHLSVKAPNPSNTYTPATSMTITFKNPTALPPSPFTIFYQDNPVPNTPIQITEGESRRFQIKRELADGTFVGIEQEIGSATINTIKWWQRRQRIMGTTTTASNELLQPMKNRSDVAYQTPYFDTETPVANTVTVSVDIEVPAPPGGGVWATVALSFQVQILPAPPPISGYNIVDEYSQFGNTSCKGGDPNTYVAYARQQIEATDQAMYNELINNRQIDIVLVTKQHPDAIRQVRPNSGDIIFGWSETNLSANSRLILNTNGSVTFPPSGRYRDCPNNAEFALEISSGEDQILVDIAREPVGAGNYEMAPQDVKDIVDKISAANPSMRAILVSICENGPESRLAPLRAENKLVYTPSEAQLAEMIQLPLKASIYLVVDNLCDVSNYCEASASPNDVVNIRDRKQVLRDWYNNASSSTIQNNGTLQDARRRQYTRTLAHEMGHIYYAIQNKTDRYKWDLLRDAFPVFAGDTCYPYRVQQHPPSGYCSRAHGHENLNGDGFFSCEKGENYPSPPPTINVN